MNIRPATSTDADRIAALWNDMIRTSLATFTTEEKSPDDVAALIAARAGAFWVAQSSTVQGFVSFGPFRAGPGYAATVEHTIILAPDARGSGQGRALMDHAMTRAQHQGHHVMIGGISSANTGAVAFHEALGFAQVGVLREVGYKHGQWLDLIFMQKTLHPS